MHAFGVAIDTHQAHGQALLEVMGTSLGIELIRKWLKNKLKFRQAPNTPPKYESKNRSLSISYKPLRQKLHHVAQHVLGIGVCQTTIFL